MKDDGDSYAVLTLRRTFPPAVLPQEEESYSEIKSLTANDGQLERAENSRNINGLAFIATTKCHPPAVTHLRAFTKIGLKYCERSGPDLFVIPIF